MAFGPVTATHADMGERYADYFKAYVKRAADLELLDKRLAQYDLDCLAAARERGGRAFVLGERTS